MSKEACVERCSRIEELLEEDAEEFRNAMTGDVAEAYMDLVNEQVDSIREIKKKIQTNCS